MLLILSPSKTQDFSAANVSEYSIPALLDKACQLVECLRGLDVEQIGSLMKTSSKLSQSTWQSFQDFDVPFDAENAKQAILAFQGDVYSGIDVEHYSKEDFLFAQKHLRILSGLYGILRPLDLIQSYRLEMGTALETDRGKNLYAFWKGVLTDEVNKILAEFSEPLLVNLASQEYYKALAPGDLKGRAVAVSFKEKKEGKYRTVAIHAKRARGKMVDFAVTNRIVNVEGLLAFSEDGYVYNERLSTSSELIFCR